jgi:hypothetical protein
LRRVGCESLGNEQLEIVPRRTLPLGAEFMFGGASSVGSIPFHFDVSSGIPNGSEFQSGKFLGGLDVLDQ